MPHDYKRESELRADDNLKLCQEIDGLRAERDKLRAAGEALHQAVAGYLIDSGARSSDGMTWHSQHGHPLAKPYLAASAVFDGEAAGKERSDGSKQA